MAKYFLGSVGTAEAFRKNSAGKLEVAFVSKTLTDSGINISTTKDDLRAGTGAPIVASFYHDPSVEITLTDVMFKTEYVEAQLGADFEANQSAYQSEELTVASHKVTLAKMPLPLNLGCSEADGAHIWFTVKGKDAWTMITMPVAAKEVNIPETVADGSTICVRYLAEDDAARAAEIKSNMIPQELYLIITAPIFAGDACDASNGKQAGTIQFEVPRFRLAGAQDFAMAMSSNQTLSLAGSALAVEDGCEINGSKLLRIVEVIYNRAFYEGLESIIPDEDHLTEGESPVIYGVYKNGSVIKLDNSKIYFADVLGSPVYVWPSSEGSTTVKVSVKDNEGHEIDSDTVTIAAAA